MGTGDAITVSAVQKSAVLLRSRYGKSLVEGKDALCGPFIDAATGNSDVPAAG
jgi:hypothetical protein